MPVSAYASQLTENFNRRELQGRWYRVSRRSQLFFACLAQLYTQTPEEHVANAWRRLDPTTRVLTKHSPMVEQASGENQLGQKTDDAR